MVIISINGMDNSGKTTQSNILTNKYPDIFIKKLHISDMESFDNEKFNFSWWFSRTNAEEFVNSIYRCLEERIAIAKQLNRDDAVVILEKGLDFYDTRIIATLVAKGYPLDYATYLQQEIRKKYKLEDVEDIKIYLKPGNYINHTNIEPSEEVLYNQYLSMNRLLLELSNIDYKYIETDSIENVTKNILEVIKEGYEKNHVKQIIM